MPKLNRLATKTVESAGVGKLCDGGGLYFVVRPNGTRHWVFRYIRHGRERQMGLGPFEDVSLAQARVKARDARGLLRDGRDPLTERRLAARGDIPTFAEAATQYAEDHAAKWTNPHHRKMWRRQLEIHADPKIGSLPVNEVVISDVMRVLRPIWLKHNETASRIRGRIEKILGWATVNGYRTGDNPAVWRGRLEALLPSPSEVQSTTHYAALPWEQVPAFMVKLRAREGVGAAALEFVILSAARSGEVRGARWSEIDLDAKLWVVPAKRMKARVEHRVPLSSQSLDLLRSLVPVEGNDLVFLSPRKTAKISDMTMTKVLRDMKVDAVPLGFRSSFRDWAAESTSYAREVAEQALAHIIENKVEAAYRRGDLLAKRRKMMQAWANFLDTGVQESGEVVPIGKGNR